MFQENKTKCRLLWRAVNKIILKCNTKNNASSSLLVDGGSVANTKDIFESFDDCFVSVGQNLCLKLLPTKTETVKLL